MLNFLRKKSLIPAWHYTCSGTLWRLKVSERGNILGEDRDTEKKTVSFFCVDEITGNVLWQNLTFDEKFWIAIDGVYGGYAFFHEFKSPNMPEHKKIYAYDIATGAPRWHNDELRFLFAHNNAVYASKESFTARNFYELAIDTGEIIRELGTDIAYINTLQDTAETTQPYHLLELPTAVTKEEFFKNGEYAGLKKNFPLQKISGEIELYSTDNFLVTSFYENLNENPFELNLLQHLHIYEKGNNFKQVFSDVITTNAFMTIADTFFVKNGILYFIKDRKTLTAIVLT